MPILGIFNYMQGLQHISPANDDALGVLVLSLEVTTDSRV